MTIGRLEMGAAVAALIVLAMDLGVRVAPDSAVSGGGVQTLPPPPDVRVANAAPAIDLSRFVPAQRPDSATPGAGENLPEPDGDVHELRVAKRTLRLWAVLIADDRRVAVVRETVDGQSEPTTHSVSAGDGLIGYTVAAVDRNRLRLRGPTASFDLLLFDPDAGNQAAAGQQRSQAGTTRGRR